MVNSKFTITYDPSGAFLLLTAEEVESLTKEFLTRLMADFPSSREQGFALCVSPFTWECVYQMLYATQIGMKLDGVNVTKRLILTDSVEICPVEGIPNWEYVRSSQP